MQSSLETPQAARDRLTEVTGFGPNPGNLRMFTYVPQTVSPSPALVVVLHGCTQTAAGYDHGAGWSTLADRYGFVLLLPEQQEANNPKLCFNWFQLGDIQRDHGEAASIRQMVERTIRNHAVDRDRVFVTGLSAGGAMTSAMLAAYPEVFAGGAIIAGLPYRCANNVSEAFECMFQGKTRSTREWGDLVRSASPHRGPWPSVSVWHGSMDATVKHTNAGEIIKQWTDVHGLPPATSRDEIVDGYPRRVWTNSAGDDVIEEYVITGMAHGTPLATGDGENSYGVAGPFLLDAGISSSYHIAKFWGLAEKSAGKSLGTTQPKAAPKPIRQDEEVADVRRFTSMETMSDQAANDAPRHEDHKSPLMADIGAVIMKALKAAGLMK